MKTFGRNTKFSDTGFGHQSSGLNNNYVKAVPLNHMVLEN